MIKKTGNTVRSCAAVLAAVMMTGALISGCGGSDKAAETTAAETAAAQTETEASESGAQDTEASETADKETSEAAEAQSEISVLHPFVKREVKSEYDDEGDLLASTEYDAIGIHDEGEGLDALSEALSAYNRQREQNAAITQDTLAEIAREDAEESEDFYGYQSISGIDIKRADGRVLSFTDSFYEYTGGVHGNGGTTGISFDAKTGERLDLSDLISDKDALKDYVMAELEARYGADGGLFDGWQDTVRNDIDEVPYAETEGFEDAEGKTNLSLSSVGGEILSISQFTLAATLRHSGNRPSFSSALEAETAEHFYHAFDAYLGSLLGLEVKEGVFGGDMEVELVNDGPFTLVLDSADLGKEARP